MKQTDNTKMAVEVIKFRRDDYQATIATNGRQHVSQEQQIVKLHRTLPEAIAYLEVHGWRIVPDDFEGFE